MHDFENVELSLEKRVNDLISRLSLKEKIAFVAPFHPAIERFGMPEFHSGGEGAHGVVMRDGEKSTVFPQPLGLSMTWDKELMKEIGSVIGDEGRGLFKKGGRKGMITLFFPTIDMERDPRWGRNEEAYGEDPFLAGKLAVELIKGAQGEDEKYLKIVATPKHFYANNYEFERTSTDSIIGEKLKYEYYLRVFAYAFEEGHAASLMTAYNKINGAVGMLNPEMNTLIREKWGADAFFVSDGGAFGLAMTEHKAAPTYAEIAAEAIKAGLDIFLDKMELAIDATTEAIERGLLTEGELDESLRRHLRILFKLGVYGGKEWIDGNPYEKIGEDVICSKAAAQTAKRAAFESVTLLKNDGFLPLKPEAIKKIAVVGQLGDENLPDWYSGNPPYEKTPLQGIKEYFPKSEVVYNDACDVAAFSTKDGKWLCVAEDGKAFLGEESEKALFRVSDWGYGGFGFQNKVTGKYLTTTPEGELRCDADALWGWFVRELFFMEDGKFCEEKPHGTVSGVGVAMKRGVNVYDKPYGEGAADKVNAVLSQLTMQVVKDGLAEAIQVVKGADAAVVVSGNHPLVGARECIDRDTLDYPARWATLLDGVSAANKNTVLALIAGYPYSLEKQEAAARAVIFTTHGAQEVGSAVGATLSGVNNPSGHLSMTWYREGRILPDINDYDIVKNKMTYMYNDMPVLHPFGFGLGYTEFAFGGLTFTEKDGAVVAGLDVENTGKVKGAAVPQLYVADVSPIKRLVGFARVVLEPGEKQYLEIVVSKKELARYDTKKGEFVLLEGEYTFAAGANAEDLTLRQTIKVHEK